MGYKKRDFFMVKVVRYWAILPREVVDASFTEIF